MICKACKKPTTPIEANFGIGSYEFWGSIGSNDNIQTVSKCCYFDIVDKLEEENDEPEQSDS